MSAVNFSSPQFAVLSPGRLLLCFLFTGRFDDWKVYFNNLNPLNPSNPWIPKVHLTLKPLDTLSRTFRWNRLRPKLLSECLSLRHRQEQRSWFVRTTCNRPSTKHQFIIYLLSIIISFLWMIFLFFSLCKLSVIVISFITSCALWMTLL